MFYMHIFSRVANWEANYSGQNPQICNARHMFARWRPIATVSTNTPVAFGALKKHDSTWKYRQLENECREDFLIDAWALCDSPHTFPTLQGLGSGYLINLLTSCHRAVWFRKIMSLPCTHQDNDKQSQRNLHGPSKQIKNEHSCGK